MEDKKEQGVSVIALFDRERPFCKTSREVRHVIQRADQSEPKRSGQSCRID